MVAAAGYFPKVKDVPPVVVRHVREDVGLGGDVELQRAAVRSAKRHREFVRKRMKVTYDGAGVRKIAEDAIRKAVQAKDDPMEAALRDAGFETERQDRPPGWPTSSTGWARGSPSGSSPRPAGSR
jgi:hypothetical protein